MKAMDWKGHPSIKKAARFEEEPTFRVPFIGCALCIAGSPYIIVIVCRSAYGMHVAGVEFTTKKYVWLVWLAELETLALWNAGLWSGGLTESLIFHFWINYWNKMYIVLFSIYIGSIFRKY